MKFNRLLFAFAASGAFAASAGNLPVATTNLVGEGIVEFIPQGFDQTKTPSLILKEEPKSIGAMPQGWSLVPEFTMVDGKASATLPLSGEISLYGGRSEEHTSELQSQR